MFCFKLRYIHFSQLHNLRLPKAILYPHSIAVYRQPSLTHQYYPVFLVAIQLFRLALMSPREIFDPQASYPLTARYTYLFYA